MAGIVNNQGINNSQLNSPVDVVIDYARNLYIADRDNHRVQKYLLGSSIGQTVAGNGLKGSSQYQLNSPSRVLIDSNENLYIADMNNNRIQFWRNGAISGTTIAGTTGKNTNDKHVFFSSTVKVSTVKYLICSRTI